MWNIEEQATRAARVMRGGADSHVEESLDPEVAGGRYLVTAGTVVIVQGDPEGAIRRAMEKYPDAALITVGVSTVTEDYIDYDVGALDAYPYLGKARDVAIARGDTYVYDRDTGDLIRARG